MQWRFVQLVKQPCRKMQSNASKQPCVAHMLAVPESTGGGGGGVIPASSTELSSPGLVASSPVLPLDASSPVMLVASSPASPASSPVEPLLPAE
jgi:hypothetical protein